MTEEAKPATDAMIESDRAVYGAVLGHTIARYIARIDAERAVLAAAKARVKALTEALYGVAATFDSYAAMHDAKGTAEAKLKAEANREHARKARAALKEPANG